MLFRFAAAAAAAAMKSYLRSPDYSLLAIFAAMMLMRARSAIALLATLMRMLLPGAARC